MKSKSKQYKIYCSGMLRSASTWSFNVCRKLLELQNLNIEEGYFGEREKVGSKLENWIKCNQNFLIKFHHPDSRTLDFLTNYEIKNIHTFRDPRDAAVSLNKFFKKTLVDSVLEIKECLITLDRYKEIGNTLFIQYKDFYMNSFSSIQQIAKFINIDVTKNEVDKINFELSRENIKQVTNSYNDNFNTIRQENMLYDNSTQFHEGHIVSSKIGRWKKELSEEEQDYVNSEFSYWLFKYF